MAYSWEKPLDMVVAGIGFMSVLIGYIILMIRRKHFLLYKKSQVFITLATFVSLAFMLGLILRDSGNLGCVLWTLYYELCYILYSISWLVHGYTCYLNFLLSESKFKSDSKLEPVKTVFTPRSRRDSFAGENTSSSSKMLSTSLGSSMPSESSIPITDRSIISDRGSINDRVTLQRAVSDHVVKEQRFYKFIRFIKIPWQIAVCVVWCSFFILFNSLMIYFLDYDQMYDVNNPDTLCTFYFEKPGLALVLVFSAVIIIMQAIMYHKHLKGQRDGLRMKRDMKAVLSTWIPGFIIWIIFTFVGLRTAAVIAAILSYSIAWWTTLGWCLIESFYDQNRRKYRSSFDSRRSTDSEADIDLSQSKIGGYEKRVSNNLKIAEITDLELTRSNYEINIHSNQVVELKDVMSNSKFRDRFLEFLKGEWSTENLYFMEECLHYKALVDTMIAKTNINEAKVAIKNAAKEIFDKYFETTSIFQVNLDHFMKKNVEESLKNIDNMNVDEMKKIFEQAESTVYQMVQVDSFRRYTRSDLFPRPNINSEGVIITQI